MKMKSALSVWKEEMRQVSLPVFLLVVVFAIASWVDIYGVYVELPIMVSVLPEGWNLPSYLVIITQAANIGPLIVTIAKKFFPSKVHDWMINILIVFTGIIACILLGFFWDSTTTVGSGGEGGEREVSTALFALTCCLALVDCTSSVVFLPYMATFRPVYLTALYVGEGLSGLLPALIVLIQGVGGDPICLNQTSSTNQSYEMVAVYPPPRFSVDTFFFILSGMLGASLIAFLILHFHPAGVRERQYRQPTITIPQGSTDSYTLKHEDSDDMKPGPPSNYNSSKSALSDGQCQKVDIELTDVRPVSINTSDLGDSIKGSSLSEEIAGSENGAHVEVVPPCMKVFSELTSPPEVNISLTVSLTSKDMLMVLIIVGFINALTNGILPSLQSFSCLPYGNAAYDLSVRLSVIANPVSCFFGIFVVMHSVTGIVAFSVAGTLCAAYHVVLASLSPYPPLFDDPAGAAIAVTTFVLMTALFSYVKLCCAARLSSRAGTNGLLWCGFVSQLGSCLGAIVAFILVNVLKLFESKQACT